MAQVLEKNTLDVQKIRKDFPVLKRKVHGKPLVYLDNAATTLKPQSVINAVSHHYSMESANIHRGVHHLSELATSAYEKTRETVKKFINARSTKEIIFTRGTTDSINLVCQSYGRSFLKKGDEIIITAMEHHSNIVPWQILKDEIGCILKVVPINKQGEMIWQEFEKLITNKTKLLSVSYISNALGTINPVKNIIGLAHNHSIPVLLDAAQAMAHTQIDVQELYSVFSKVTVAIISPPP